MSFKKLFILTVLVFVPGMLFAMEGPSDSKRACVVNSLELLDEDRLAIWEAEITAHIFNFDNVRVNELLILQEARELTDEQRNYLYEMAENIYVRVAPCNQTKKIKNILYAFRFLKKFKFPQVHFSPRPYHHLGYSLDKILEALIVNEQDSIASCCFHLTLFNIAKLLVDQKNEGVAIDIVTNQRQGDTAPLQALKLLADNGIAIAAPRHRQQYEDNHHKFFIFTSNVLSKALVWNGSYNPTGHANKNSWDDVTIFDDAEIVQDFRSRFVEIKAASETITREELENTVTNPYRSSLENNNVPYNLW